MTTYKAPKTKFRLYYSTDLPGHRGSYVDVNSPGALTEDGLRQAELMLEEKMRVSRAKHNAPPFAPGHPNVFIHRIEPILAI